MLKRIIFDVDNTLIMWKDKYCQAVNRTLEKLNYPYDEETVKKIDYVIGSYEESFNRLEKKSMMALINKQLDKKLPESFIDILLEEQPFDTETDEDVTTTLEYLSGKYEIVALTNWFAEGQIKRLEAAGLLKYISKVYGADTFLIKPNEEGFLKAMGTHQPNECMMIGDSLRCDIEPAIKLGMQVIHYNYKNNVDTSYLTINKFKQLKEIL